MSGNLWHAARLIFLEASRNDAYCLTIPAFFQFYPQSFKLHPRVFPSLPKVTKTPPSRPPKRTLYGSAWTGVAKNRNVKVLLFLNRRQTRTASRSLGLLFHQILFYSTNSAHSVHPVCGGGVIDPFKRISPGRTTRDHLDGRLSLILI